VGSAPIATKSTACPIRPKHQDPEKTRLSLGGGREKRLQRAFYGIFHRIA